LLLAAGSARAQQSAPPSTTPLPGSVEVQTPSGPGKIVCIPHPEKMPVAGHECSLQRVHFEFDSADLGEDAKPLLDKSADCLKSNPEAHVTIAGGTDDIGSDTYNLELGKRRAVSVATYLESKGVDAGRIREESVGKDNPLCSEKTDSCRSMNRRAAVLPMANPRQPVTGGAPATESPTE
jgi:outer membrane protein OmpA-like peptidoglycan-associated protein